MLTLGGDHSIAMGTVSGIAKAVQERLKSELALVWIDAHSVRFPLGAVKLSLIHSDRTSTFPLQVVPEVCMACRLHSYWD